MEPILDVLCQPLRFRRLVVSGIPRPDLGARGSLGDLAGQTCVRGATAFVWVAPDLSDDEARLTLAHELAHVALIGFDGDPRAGRARLIVHEAAAHRLACLAVSSVLGPDAVTPPDNASTSLAVDQLMPYFDAKLTMIAEGVAAEEDRTRLRKVATILMDTYAGVIAHQRHGGNDPGAKRLRHLMEARTDALGACAGALRDSGLVDDPREILARLGMAAGAVEHALRQLDLWIDGQPRTMDRHGGDVSSSFTDPVPPQEGHSVQVE